MAEKPSDLSLSFTDSPPAPAFAPAAPPGEGGDEGLEEESVIVALAEDLLDATRAGDTEAIADVLRAVRDM